MSFQGVAVIEIYPFMIINFGQMCIQLAYILLKTDINWFEAIHISASVFLEHHPNMVHTHYVYCLPRNVYLKLSYCIHIVTRIKKQHQNKEVNYNNNNNNNRIYLKSL